MKKNIFFTLIILSQIINGASLIGKRIPKARIRMVDGEYAKLSDFYSEGPLIIDFWTTWWTYCERQLGYLNELNTAFQNVGLQVLAVNVNKPNTINQVRPYIKKRKYKFNVSVDPSSKLAKRFKVLGFPTFFLVDKNGTIIYKSAGYEKGMENKYLSKLLEYYDSEGIKYDDFKYTEEITDNSKDPNIRIDF